MFYLTLLDDPQNEVCSLFSRNAKTHYCGEGSNYLVYIDLDAEGVIKSHTGLDIFVSEGYIRRYKNFSLAP